MYEIAVKGSVNVVIVLHSTHVTTIQSKKFEIKILESAQSLCWLKIMITINLV